MTEGVQTKVAAIIPAYNEEKTIGSVVKTVVESRLFDEVIVISDGSTDQTASVARAAGATTVHELPVKGGKGGAMLHGVTHTDAQILFFMDADLYNLKKEHLEAVLRPVLEGKKAMNVCLRDRGPLLTNLSAHLPLIGGERALLRHVIERVPQKFLRGFMIEAALNYHCRKEKLPYGSVPCAGLSMRKKMEKVGFWRGLVEYIEMFYQVFKAMILVRFARWRGEF
ncbi:glycosyltransferase [Candidatus Uhrbacteria bacterium]|nr:glycosyltransferase [Candidatus Uhrbacteria bacterium]